MHRDRAIAPSALDCDGGGRDRGGAGGARLPRSALPDEYRQIVAAVDPHELDVRALGEAWMVLDERAESKEVVTCRLVEPDHRMWIADRHGCQLDPVDNLRLADSDLPHVGVRCQSIQHASSDPSPGGLDRDVARPRLGSEPTCRDPDAVARHLGRRAVGIPDRDDRVWPVAEGDLDDAVRADTRLE